MACEILSTTGAVFALWGTPSSEDMDRVHDAVCAAAASCGHPIVYVTRVPVDAPAPGADARSRLDSLMPDLVKSCSSYHVVLEGDGFAAAMKRGILTGIFQMSWRRGTFFVHARVDQVERAVAPTQRARLSTLLQAAGERGLLQRSLD